MKSPVQIPDAPRLVVKVGSSSLATAAGGLDIRRLDALVDALAARVKAGQQVVLVSSGAIAAGIAPLGLSERPKDVATQQAAAAVGQGALVAAYAAAFARHRLTVAQLLLTSSDVIIRGRYRNARRSLNRLLELGVIPIINENDAVAVDEIRFGDNDRLAALVAHLADAQALVLLSDVDALYDRPPSDPAAQQISYVPSVAELTGVTIGAAGSGVGTGGMVTKIQAAQMATSTGVTTLLTSADLAYEALCGEAVGTIFAPTHRRRSPRLLWLAYAATPQGRLVLDKGAVTAVQGTASLLPAGVIDVSGVFEAGDAIEMVTQQGHVIARGFVNASSDEIPAMMGRSTHDLARELGPEYERELVHRDQLVVLNCQEI
ncbi:MAG: glutamate 5-kinase [Propionibacteriaceae bacterium]